MKPKPTHIAYDYGVLDFLGKTKTKTTLCGVVVPSSRIDNDNPTCPQCIHERDEAEALIALLQSKQPNQKDIPWDAKEHEHDTA